MLSHGALAAKPTDKTGLLTVVDLFMIEHIVHVIGDSDKFRDAHAQMHRVHNQSVHTQHNTSHSA